MLFWNLFWCWIGLRGFRVLGFFGGNMGLTVCSRNLRSTGPLCIQEPTGFSAVLYNCSMGCLQDFVQANGKYAGLNKG